MSLVNVNGLDYYYEERGVGQPLVLLHGFTGSSANWQQHMISFAVSYRVIAIDLLGHGRTSSPPTPERYRMRVVCNDLAAIFTALNLPAINLLGYSMGGRLALYIAANQPALLRSLILESASPGLQATQQRLARIDSDERLAEKIETFGILQFVDRWQRLPLFASQKRMSRERRDSLYRQRLDNRALGLANSLRGMGTGQQPSLWSELEDIHLPVLLLAGELDNKYSALASQMEMVLPDAKLQIVPNVGHNIHLENPDGFLGHVLTFIEGLRSVGPR